VLNVARYDIDGLREALLSGRYRPPAADAGWPDARRRGTTAGALGNERGNPGIDAIRIGMDAGKPVDMLLKDAKVWGPRQIQ
jgi:DNA polymerase-3 subunit delta